jgi:hypothetical protein
MDGKINPITLPGSYVNDIAMDKDGGVWFTLGGMETKNQKGAAYLKDGNITSYTKESTDGKLLSDFVQSVEIDSTGKVWFGTAAGLSAFNPSSNNWNSWTKKDGIPAESINTISTDDKGGIWIGTYPDTVDAENNIYSGGYAYISSTGAIKTYKDDRNTNFADQWVRNISLDPEGGVWVVKSGSYSTMANTGGRVDYINPQGEIVTSYTGHELLPGELKDNAEIRTMAVDHKGSLWFGTTSKGIFFSKSPKTVNKKFSGANSDWESTSSMDSIWSLVVTEDSLWAGSNGGVVHALSDNIFSKAKAPVFTDIQGNWAQNHIEYLTSKGIVNGTGANTFSPNKSLTRAEFVKLLVGTLGNIDLTTAKIGTFKDIADKQWYTDYANWAGEKGIVEGDDNGNFGPNDMITREQMAVMLLNFADAMNIKLEMVNEPVEFKDASQISSWAAKPVSIVQRSGLINGKPDGSFDSKGSATRAEAAKVIKMLIDVMN